MHNRSNTVYLGLAVLMMGLFAGQIRNQVQVPHSSDVKKNESLIAAPRPESENARIFTAYQRLLGESFFTQKIEGITVIPKPSTGQTLTDHFTLILSGSEVYGSHDARVQKNWETILDRIADLLDDDPGLKMEISGYADADDPLENRNAENGLSPLAFSFSRAEWIARYFETAHGADIASDFILRGMGPAPKGKRVELKILIPKTTSGGN